MPAQWYPVTRWLQNNPMPMFFFFFGFEIPSSKFQKSSHSHITSLLARTMHREPKCSLQNKIMFSTFLLLPGTKQLSLFRVAGLHLWHLFHSFFAICIHPFYCGKEPRPWWKATCIVLPSYQLCSTIFMPWTHEPRHPISMRFRLCSEAWR